MSYFHGRHSLKAGFAFRRVHAEQAKAGTALFGSVTFANTYSAVPGVAKSGNAYADFLFGVPTRAQRDYPFSNDLTNRWAYDFFVRDTWKITPRLTADLGLRYEYHPLAVSEDGRLAVFDPASGKIAVADRGMGGVSPLVPRSYVDVVKASTLGLDPERLIATDGNDFGPRVGLAWKPFRDNRTVVRSGFGIYYDVDPPDLSGAAAPPFLVAEPAYTNTQPSPTIWLPRAYPENNTAAGPATVTLPDAINPHLRMPYSMQWNFTMEREQWDTGFKMSYVGTAGRKLTYRRDINSPVVDDRMYVDKPRPFGKYPSILYMDNGAAHNYHGFTMEAERRMKRGLMYQAAYTWARSVGDDDRGTAIENPFDRARERSVFQGIPSQRMTLMAIYELPFGKGRTFLSTTPRWLDVIAGGWQLSAIGMFQSGQWLTPSVSIPDPTGTVYTTGRNRPLVSIRPDQLRDARLQNPTIDRWFDPAAFAAPPTGRFGNGARGVVLGPGGNIWHGGLFKYVTFADNPRLPKLRVEMTGTNCFNHPNWSNPVTNLSNAVTVGSIRSAGGASSSQFADTAGARSMQVGLRLEW